MTPNMKVIFSRVRTILADCHEAASEVMRCEICKGRGGGERRSGRVGAAYLELELLHLALEVVREDLARGRLELVHKVLLEHLLERPAGLDLEAVAVLREIALEQVQAGVEEGLHGVCGGRAAVSTLSSGLE